MRAHSSLFRGAWLFFLLAIVLSRATETPIAPGRKFASFTVGATTYTDVQVRSITARTVTFTHSGGLASVHLRDLSPEWQARFRYDPARDAAAEQMLATARPPPPPANSRQSAARGNMEELVHRFGTPAALAAEIDLRPKFFQLELGVKNQGRRPSCAIFAIVSALEFQNAEVTGHAEKFSEEYLLWATRQTTHRVPPAHAASSAGDESTPASPANDDADEGFTLADVVAAVRGYGIPLQSSMPNTFGRAIDAIEAPTPAIVAEARQHQSIHVFVLPGHDNATRIANILHTLNAGIPVVIGLGWPHYRTLHGGYLGGQKPIAGRGHAVTLVGYTSKSDQPDDVVFVFKNSWGVDWGQGGYGTVAYRYLNNYLGDAVFLEVLPRR